MRIFLTSLLFIGCVALTFNAESQTQDLKVVLKKAEEFLILEATQLSKENSIQLGQVDKRLKLHHCDELIPFLPNASKAWGNTTVGVKCVKPKPWVVYLSAQVKIFGDYFQTRTGLAQGKSIDENDLLKTNGEISAMPATIVTDINQALGKTMLTSINAGMTLRQEMYRATPIIQQGQTIKVIYQGLGFSVSNEAIALSNASIGQLVKAKTHDGLVIAGTAKSQGIIEIIN